MELTVGHGMCVFVFQTLRVWVVSLCVSDFACVHDVCLCVFQTLPVFMVCLCVSDAACVGGVHQGV